MSYWKLNMSKVLTQQILEFLCLNYTEEDKGLFLFLDQLYISHFVKLFTCSKFHYSCAKAKKHNYCYFILHSSTVSTWRLTILYLFSKTLKCDILDHFYRLGEAGKGPFTHFYLPLNLSGWCRRPGSERSQKLCRPVKSGLAFMFALDSSAASNSSNFKEKDSISLI